MKSLIPRLLSTSMIALGLCALSGCFDGGGPYYGGGPGYAPGYAYAPEYVAPYRGGPVYYPQTYRAPAPGYYVPGRGPVRYYNGGEHAWEHHEAPGPEHRAAVAPEHHEDHGRDHH